MCVNVMITMLCMKCEQFYACLPVIRWNGGIAIVYLPVSPSDQGVALDYKNLQQLVYVASGGCLVLFDRTQCCSFRISPWQLLGDRTARCSNTLSGSGSYARQRWSREGEQFTHLRLTLGAVLSANSYSTCARAPHQGFSRPSIMKKRWSKMVFQAFAEKGSGKLM